MQKYVEKMIIEKKDLESKIKRAENVIENPPYGTDKTGMLLLAEQVKAMKEYLSCLNSRLIHEQGK